MTTRILIAAAFVAVPCRADDPPAVARARRSLAAGGLPTGGADLVGRLSQKRLAVNEVKALIRGLGSRSFRERQAATERLASAGDDAVGLLKAAAGDADPEVARRARRALTSLKPLTDARSWAAARVLAFDRPDGTADALLSLIESADGTRRDLLIAAAAPGLTATAVGTLKGWLTDEKAARRYAAGVLLAGRADCREAVRELLDDPDSAVRHEVALNLLRHKDRAALPHVVEALRGGNRGRVFRAEHMLRRLKRDGPPPLALTTSLAEGPGQVKLFWAEWAADYEGDLSGLDEPPPPLGRTVIANYGNKKVRCLDRGGEELWSIAADGPYRARPRPDGTLVLAEWKSQAVTIRDARGAVVWKSPRFAKPTVAGQELPDGTVFVATRSELFIIDRDGVRVREYPTGLKPDQIYDAEWLPDGSVIFMTGEELIELNPDGGERRRVKPAAAKSLKWGRLTRLPGGGFLVCDNKADLVIECDRAGKTVRKVSTPRPSCAKPLPGGGVLVASSTGYVAEFDKAGKRISKWETGGRPFWAVPQ